MKARSFIILAACFLFLAALGCDKIDIFKSTKTNLGPVKETKGPSQEVKGKAIAKVNNMLITLEELDQEVQVLNANVPPDKPEAKITTREQKINYLKNDLVRGMLLYQAALDKGLDKKEEVLKALEKARHDLVVVELLREEAENVDVSSAEVEDYYNTYKEQLKEPEERQIREIMVPTEQEAKDILIQLLQGADFVTLAKERSQAASAANGGDLGFIKKGARPGAFDDNAFSESLEAGKTTNIFKGAGGYYVLKLEAKRGGKQKSLSEMWEDIKRGLRFLKQQQKIEDLVGKLSREAKIEIYEGEIK